MHGPSRPRSNLSSPAPLGLAAADWTPLEDARAAGRSYCDAGEGPAQQGVRMATKKGIVGKAVDAVAEANANPPTAPTPLTMKPARKAAKKSSAKKASAKKAAPKMDRKLVSTMEDYEVKYLAQKWKVSQKAVKEAVAKVGHSRNKVEAELKRGKA